MEKKRVTDILEEIALLLEVSGESPFKSRAYENAARTRLDLDSASCRLGRSLGARFAIDPDAHDEAGLSDVRFGVAVARRAGLTAADVLNTVSADRLDAALARPPA